MGTGDRKEAGEGKDMAIHEHCGGQGRQINGYMGKLKIEEGKAMGN